MRPGFFGEQSAEPRDVISRLTQHPIRSQQSRAGIAHLLHSTSKLTSQPTTVLTPRASAALLFATMASPKHRLSITDSEGPDPKRLRVSDDAGPLNGDATPDQLSATPAPPHLTIPNLHTQSRQALQRSIALVLHHDGFSATTPEALESFTQLVETCEWYIVSPWSNSRRLQLFI